MTEAAAKLTLGTDWSIAGITDQWSQVSTWLAELKAHATAGSRLLISMESTECLDACGCQLLAVLVRDLKAMGIEPCLVEIPEALQSTIHSLGFVHCLATSDSQAHQQ